MDPREQVCEVARLAYDRRLLDSAGGNFSARIGERIYATSRYSGSRRRWQLNPEHILVLTPTGDVLEGSGETSRELRMHLGIYAALPECGGICHAHSLHVLAFANLRRPIPPSSEQTEKYGTIPLCEEKPAHSADLARVVVDALLPQREKLAKHAIACLIPYHGIVVAGRDLDDAYDALERLDGSCAVHIMTAALSRTTDELG